MIGSIDDLGGLRMLTERKRYIAFLLLALNMLFSFFVPLLLKRYFSMDISFQDMRMVFITISAAFILVNVIFINVILLMFIFKNQ